jgi:predicted nucleic acid-binding protein
MSARYFVDSNILFYAHDRQAGSKHERAKDLIAGLWASRQGALSTQVLQEFCVNVRRKAQVSAENMRSLVQDFLKWHVVVNTGESVLGALEIEAKHRISFWDSLIVYAAQVAEVEVLYSEDFNDGQIYGSVRVVNPLKP